MANKRMFSKQIVDSDAFLDMPPTAQILYFHLVMRADDDGFIGNPKKIMRMINVGEDDYKILVVKRFILVFEEGVCVIKHWWIHNTIMKDRYHLTAYQDQLKQLTIKENGAYTDKSVGMLTESYQDDNGLLTVTKLNETKLNETKLKLRESTPAEEARDFFNGNTEEIFKETQESTKIQESILKEEFIKFNLYWTEKNKSGTKQRWEQESTFEVRRRLFTWLSRIKNFNSKRVTKIL